MSDICVFFGRNAIAMLLGLSLFLVACGDSGGGAVPPSQSTGTVALLLTDMPTDDLKEINFDVTQATLIGDQGQQTIYNGNTRVNLLDLENYSQPIALGEVAAGTYTKLRLQIENFEIVDNDGEQHFPRPPANGRIDLLEPGGIEVVPGRTLVAHVDMDANKSIHVVQTGNGKYRVRPVVRVNFMLDGLPNELVRIEGRIAEIPDGDAVDFVLCAFDNPDVCIDVSLAAGACVFDAEGIPIDPVDESTFAVDDPVIVIGTYVDTDGDGNPGVEAIIVEKGEAEQVRGIVTEVPDTDGLFLVIDRAGVQTTVELQQDCTKIFGPDGEALTPGALQLGQGIEVEGVTSGDPAVFRAALILFDSEDDPEQVSGVIAEPIDEPTFMLATASGDIKVCLDDAAIVTVISDGTSAEGTFADIQDGRTAYAFGELDMTDGCFDAADVVVDTGE
jgi:hypothetical protein